MLWEKKKKLTSFATIRSLQGLGHAENLRALADGGSGEGAVKNLRVNVDVNALRRFDATETAALIRRPMNYIAAFQEAALEVNKN